MFLFLPALKEASDFPISIATVGLGDLRFVYTKKLETDLEDVGKAVKGCHDIVEFVPYNAFIAYQNYGGLAREMMLELPEQVISYTRKRNYKNKLLISNGQLENVAVQFQPPFQQLAQSVLGNMNLGQAVYGQPGAPMQHQQSFHPTNNARRSKPIFATTK